MQAQAFVWRREPRWQRAGSTAVEVQGSHVVMISQPDAVTDVIRTALAASS